VLVGGVYVGGVVDGVVFDLCGWEVVEGLDGEHDEACEDGDDDPFVEQSTGLLSNRSRGRTTHHPTVPMWNRSPTSEPVVLRMHQYIPAPSHRRARPNPSPTPTVVRTLQFRVGSTLTAVTYQPTTPRHPRGRVVLFLYDIIGAVLKMGVLLVGVAVVQLLRLRLRLRLLLLLLQIMLLRILLRIMLLLLLLLLLRRRRRRLFRYSTPVPHPVDLHQGEQPHEREGGCG